MKEEIERLLSEIEAEIAKGSDFPHLETLRHVFRTLLDELGKPNPSHVMLRKCSGAIDRN